jgi:hypothetical protein
MGRNQLRSLPGRFLRSAGSLSGNQRRSFRQCLERRCHNPGHPRLRLPEE